MRIKNKFTKKQVILLVVIAIILIMFVMIGGKKYNITQENISVPYKDFKIIK